MKKYIFLILLAASSVESYGHSCLETVANDTLNVTESVLKNASAMIGSAALGFGASALAPKNPILASSIVVIAGTSSVAKTFDKFDQCKTGSGLKKLFTQLMPFVLGYCAPAIYYMIRNAKI